MGGWLLSSGRWSHGRKSTSESDGRSSNGMAWKVGVGGGGNE